MVGDREGRVSEVRQVAERPQVISQRPKRVAGRDRRGRGCRRGELLVGQKEVDARSPEVTVGDGGRGKTGESQRRIDPVVTPQPEIADSTRDRRAVAVEPPQDEAVGLYPEGVTEISRWLSASDTTGSAAQKRLFDPGGIAAEAQTGDGSRQTIREGTWRHGGRGRPFARTAFRSWCWHPSGMRIGLWVLGDSDPVVSSRCDSTTG